MRFIASETMCAPVSNKQVLSIIIGSSTFPSTQWNYFNSIAQFSFIWIVLIFIHYRNQPDYRLFSECINISVQSDIIMLKKLKWKTDTRTNEKKAKERKKIIPSTQFHLSTSFVSLALSLSRSLLSPLLFILVLPPRRFNSLYVRLGNREHVNSE